LAGGFFRRDGRYCPGVAAHLIGYSDGCDPVNPSLEGLAVDVNRRRDQRITIPSPNLEVDPVARFNDRFVRRDVKRYRVCTSLDGE
jgi:hypothetical protein